MQKVTGTTQRVESTQKAGQCAEQREEGLPETRESSCGMACETGEPQTVQTNDHDSQTAAASQETQVSTAQTQTIVSTIATIHRFLF